MKYIITTLIILLTITANANTFSNRNTLNQDQINWLNEHRTEDNYGHLGDFAWVRIGNQIYSHSRSELRGYQDPLAQFQIEIGQQIEGELTNVLERTNESQSVYQSLIDAGVTSERARELTSQIVPGTVFVDRLIEVETPVETITLVETVIQTVIETITVEVPIEVQIPDPQAYERGLAEGISRGHSRALDDARNLIQDRLADQGRLIANAYQQGVASVDRTITDPTGFVSVSNSEELRDALNAAGTVAITNARNNALRNRVNVQNLWVSGDAVRTSLIDHVNGDGTSTGADYLISNSNQVNAITSDRSYLYIGNDGFNNNIIKGNVIGTIVATSPLGTVHSWNYNVYNIGSYTLNNLASTVAGLVANVVTQGAFEAGYIEGALAGYEAGYGDGYGDGYRDGYEDGFTDGVNSVQ